MGLAANCLRFVEAMGVGEDAATEAFLLVEDLRAVLEAEKAPPVLLPLYFRLRLAGALGFAPNLGQCGRCGRTISEDALFVVDEGQLALLLLSQQPLRTGALWRGDPRTGA